MFLRLFSLAILPLVVACAAGPVDSTTNSTTTIDTVSQKDPVVAFMEIGGVT